MVEGELIFDLRLPPPPGDSFSARRRLGHAPSGLPERATALEVLALDETTEQGCERERYAPPQDAREVAEGDLGFARRQAMSDAPSNSSAGSPLALQLRSKFML